MKRTASAAAVTLAALLAGTTDVLAQPPGVPAAALPADAPATLIADTTTATAKICGVDRAGRKVTLRGADGAEKTLALAPDVSDFDQIQLGDAVTVEYADPVVVLVRARGETMSGAADDAVQIVPKGQRPGAAMLQQTETVATLQDIDYARRVVKLRTAEGAVHKINVHEHIQNLERFRKGDEVVVRYTEAVAVAIAR